MAFSGVNKSWQHLGRHFGLLPVAVAGALNNINWILILVISNLLKLY